MIPSFTLEGVPRTKKTSQRIVRAGKFSKVLPSEAYITYRAQCMAQAPIISRRLKSFGVSLPIAVPVSITATFYRDALRGDWTGFTQALADILQDMGIIKNDVLIQHWDGTRLDKDVELPRVQVWIQEISRA